MVRERWVIQGTYNSNRKWRCFFEKFASHTELWHHVNVINIGDDEFVLVTETAYSEETGLPRRQETRTPAGLLHAPPNGDPSIVRYIDGKLSTMIWHEHGVEHRTDGPSRVTLHPGATNVMTETFNVRGAPRPSSEGPFRIRYRKNGDVWQVEDADGIVRPKGDWKTGLEGLEPD